MNIVHAAGDKISFNSAVTTQAEAHGTLLSNCAQASATSSTPCVVAMRALNNERKDTSLMCLKKSTLSLSLI